MTDLHAFLWQLPLAVGMVYSLALAADLLIHVLDWLGVGELLTRWSRGSLRGTGDARVDMLRAGGYTLRAARRKSRHG